MSPDRNWRSHPGYGGFSFLDAAGFRYYLPAAMTKCLDELDDGPHAELAITLTASAGRHETGKQQWSLLDVRQRKCVAAFVRFMRDWDKANFGYETGWQEALDQCWGTFPAKE